MAQQHTAYTDAQIAEQLGALPEWSFTGGTIQRTYTTEGWPMTLMLVNALGYAAEMADHHPDLRVTYRKIVVALSTHSAAGVTDKDFTLARRFDEIAYGRS